MLFEQGNEEPTLVQARQALCGLLDQIGREGQDFLPSLERLQQDHGRCVINLRIAIGNDLPQTLLAKAVRTGAHGTVEALLERGADPNVPSMFVIFGTDRSTLPTQVEVVPLYHALLRGDARLAASLVAAGARLDPQVDGYDMVHLACFRDQLAVLRAMQPDDDALRRRVQKKPSLTPLVIAARQGHADLCRWLIERGLSPLEFVYGQRTVLQLVVTSREERCIKALPVLLDAAAEQGVTARTFSRMARSDSANAAVKDLMSAYVARQHAREAAIEAVSMATPQR